MICNYYVTLRSDDTCEFCQIWQNDKYKSIEEKPYDLKPLKQLGVQQLNVIGGEPLLREDLPQILLEAKALGFQTQMTTNGILYGEKIGWIGGLVDRLMVSLDYPFAKMHDRSRGIECFLTAVKNIGIARDRGENVIIKFIMTRDSVLYLPEMVDLSEKLKVPVYLSPVYDFYGTQGFESPTFDHIRYYSRKKNVLLNLAVLEFVKAGGNRVLYPRCKARETTITIMPDGNRVSPCFFNQSGKQGREDICSSCMRWPYMLPSFAKGLDKYFCLDLYSKFVNRRKGVRV